MAAQAPHLLCGVCQEICKRASKISCCGAQCCWGCGVRSITKARKCWNCPNICAVTGDLVKHTQLREVISQLSKDAKEVENRQPQTNIKASQLDPSGGEQKSLKFKDDTEVCEESKDDSLLEKAVQVQPTRPEEKANSDEVDLQNQIEGNSDKNLRNSSDFKEPIKVDTVDILPLKITSLEEQQNDAEEGLTDLKLSEIQPNRTVEPELIELGPSDNILNPDPVENNSEKEVESPLVKLVKDNFENNLQIGEVATTQTEDTRADSSSLVDTEIAETDLDSDLGSINFRTDQTKPLCDNIIPPVENAGLIHSEEKSSCMTDSPVKINLKKNFQKLTRKVNQADAPKLECDTDLEMFEKTLFTNANGGDHINKEAASAEEVRIVKMVEDLDKNEKIVRIIEELDKTKHLSKRRKSDDAAGLDKKNTAAKPMEAIPITNALQGLQALLKISKMSDSSSNSTKSTNSRCSDNKSGRSRNLSGNSSKSSKSRHGDQHEVICRRKSDSRERNENEYKSRKGDSKSRQGDHKDSKTRHNDPPSLTKINRSALVRDSQVETHSKSLVEEQIIKKNVVEDLQAVCLSKSGYHYEPGRSRNKFQSFQMKDIRKRLLPVPRGSNTISTRASEVARRAKEEDEVKVLSYRMVKPKTDDCQDYERIIRKVEDENPTQKSQGEPKRKVTISEEKVVRKVFEVEQAEEVHDFEKVVLDESVKETAKNGHSIGTSSEGTLNLFQKSIIKIQTQENADKPKVAPERRKSLDLIKEELERVTIKVNDNKKKSISREISSDDDMKVIMKDAQNIEKDVEDIPCEAENDRKGKSKKKKHKDDKKRKKGKYTGDIAIDARIAKKIISRIISSDKLGKTFNEVIKQEVGETESTIEKLREDLRSRSSQEDKDKKKRKKDKKKEGKEKKKKKKDKHGDEENPNNHCEERKKKKKSKERSETRAVDNDAEVDQATSQIEDKRETNVSVTRMEDDKSYRSPNFKKSKKRKSSSPVRFYDQVPDVKASDSNKEPEDSSEGRKAKKVKSEERKDNHKKKKSKKKHKRDKENQEKEDSVNPVGNNVVDSQVSAFVESKTEVQEERKVREKRSPSPNKDFDLVLGIAEDDLLDIETVPNEVKRNLDLNDSLTETEVDTTIDETDFTNNETDLSTSVIDAALEDIPVRNSPSTEDTKELEDSTRSNTNSGATSSANSEDDQSEDEDNLRALLLSQLSKTRCGPKAKSKKRSSNHSKAQSSKITKITWSAPLPEPVQPVEVSSTTPPVPPTTTTPAYPPMGSLPVYAYAYSRTFITPAEKLLYFPNLYNRIIVPLDLDSDSDSDCQPDCDSFWGEKRTSRWVSERMSYNEADPRYSQANLNLVMRQARDSSSPAPI
eukprot:GFUD01026162.1.p1 GENE.GFUD01026162.1~~GFUD01026162.1.p1  ORF type:complete len:1365 (+),score=472.77 GFUD01026162.1:89-4183(+)